jgi:soluble lytic murein transglycosylase-like protein
MQDSRTAAEPASSAPRRDDLRSLLASRWVQGILAVTAVVTVVSTAARVEGAGRGAAPTAAVPELPLGTMVAPLIPMEAFRSETVEQAWLRRAVERESQRLAAKYVERGYRVSPELAADIHLAALRHDIDPAIAFGLVRAESGFRNQATSPVGAVGLTQLMPRTATWMQPGVSRAELRNPEVNLDIGFRYLRYLLDKYDGNEDLALLAYNRGPGTVDRALRRGANPDNGYAAFVRGEANHGHRLFTNPPRASRPAANSTRRPAANTNRGSRPANNTRRPAASRAR